MTLQTATWHRTSEDLAVVHLQFPNSAWVGKLEDENCVFADSDAYRTMALACCACQTGSAVLWVTGGNTLPPSEGRRREERLLEHCEPGGLVVARLRDRVSLKGFRDVRPRLKFTSRQWQVPISAFFEEQEAEGGLCQIGLGKGSHHSDGSWLFLNYDAKAHNQLARILWDLHEDRRERLDYDLSYCVDDSFGRRTRLYYSSFRSTYRYAWESDEDMRRRMKGEE